MKSAQERRRYKRRPVLDSFSFFMVVPKKGAHRLKVHDVSEEGVLFDLDLAGEETADTPIRSGEVLDALLFVNQTVNIPLILKVVRIEKQDGVRRVGAEAAEKKGGSYAALRTLVEFVDALSSL